MTYRFGKVMQGPGGAGDDPWYRQGRVPREDYLPYQTMGMQGASWADIVRQRDEYADNPYGTLRRADGGQFMPVDLLRKRGLDVADPNSWRRVHDVMARSRGPWNPTGKQTRFAFDRWGHGAKGLNPAAFVAGMTKAERSRYAQARYGGMRDLRSGLDDPTYRRGKNTLGDAANWNARGNADWQKLVSDKAKKKLAPWEDE